MNVIFDSNYFGLRALNVAKLASSSKIYLSSEDDKVDFLKKLKMDFLYELNKISDGGGVITNIVMATESYSWRKEIFPEYKANREKKNDVDFNSFYEIMDKFLDYIMANYGVIKSKVEGAEGDDLIFLWSNVFMSKKSNTLILTVDKDLYQLSDINEDNNYIAIYNNHSANKQILVSEKLYNYVDFGKYKKMSLTEQFSKSKKDLDEHKDLKDIVGMLNGGLELKCIDKETLMMEKIFLGDKSDNIPNVLDIPPKDKKKKNNIKVNRPCLAKMVEFLDKEIGNYSFLKIKEDTNLMDNCVNFISNHFSLTNDERENVKEQLRLNYQLTILNFDNIPSKIQKTFIGSLKQLKDRKRLELNRLLNSTNSEFFKAILDLDIQDNEEDKIKVYFNN